MTLYGAKSEPAHTERRPQKKRRLSGGLDNGFLRHFKFGGYKPGTFQRLPEDLERFVQAKVRSGRFASPDEAITAAVRLLRKQEESEDARALEGIRLGLEDVRAGRTQPLADAFADIRRDLNLPDPS